MTLIIKDRVLETSTTTGTGSFSLNGAVTGFQAFSAVCVTNDTFYYLIEAVDGSGVPTGEWETGIGTYSGVNTLARTVVKASSNAGTAVTFSAGTKRVSISVIAHSLSQTALKPPLASDFGTTISYDATLPTLSDTLNDGFALQWTGALVNGDNSKGCFKALPVGNWTLISKWNYTALPLSFQYGGLCLRNSSTNKTTTIFKMFQTSSVINYGGLRQAANTAQAGGQFTAGFYGVDTMYWKLVWNGTDTKIYVGNSSDGPWLRWVTENNTYLGTADQIGFKVHSAGVDARTDGGGIVTCPYWQQDW
jgi:hypothetical protein